MRTHSRRHYSGRIFRRLCPPTVPIVSIESSSDPTVMSILRSEPKQILKKKVLSPFERRGIGWLNSLLILQVHTDDRVGERTGLCITPCFWLRPLRSLPREATAAGRGSCPRLPGITAALGEIPARVGISQTASSSTSAANWEFKLTIHAWAIASASVKSLFFVFT